MKLNYMEFLKRCIFVGIFVSAISACSDNYQKVSFDVGDVLPAGTIILTDGDKLGDLHLIPNQSLITEFEVKKLGNIEVKDVWLEVELSPVNNKSRTNLTAKTLYFDKDKQSSLSISAAGFDSDKIAGIYADCTGVCSISDNPVISFATMKPTDLGGYSFLVKKAD